MKHKIRILRGVQTVQSGQSVWTLIPHKWVAICSCGWRCSSWAWRRPDGTGALLMSLQHVGLAHEDA